VLEELLQRALEADLLLIARISPWMRATCCRPSSWIWSGVMVGGGVVASSA
jgi:hypothetical protein